MAAPAPWTLDDFLGWEPLQPDRYEFIDGVIRPRAVSTLDHNTINLNLARALDDIFETRGGSVFISEIKVVSAERGESSYPDVIATLAPVAGHEDRVAAPHLIAEVLSRPPADYERGAKLELYKAIPSLRYVLLIAQDRRLVDLYRRTQAGWEVVRFTEGAVPLDEFAGALPLAVIYEDTAL